MKGCVLAHTYTNIHTHTHTQSTQRQTHGKIGTCESWAELPSFSLYEIRSFLALPFNTYTHTHTHLLTASKFPRTLLDNKSTRVFKNAKSSREMNKNRTNFEEASETVVGKSDGAMDT